MIRTTEDRRAAPPDPENVLGLVLEGLGRKEAERAATREQVDEQGDPLAVYYAEALHVTEAGTCEKCGAWVRVEPGWAHCLNGHARQILMRTSSERRLQALLDNAWAPASIECAPERGRL